MDETKPRNTRMTDEEWFKINERARAERMMTGDNLTASDIVRKAVEMYLKTKIQPTKR
jgi:hypothetical protein